MNSDQFPPDSIDEDGRRRFERAWLEGHPGPIGQFLPPPDDPRYQATLEELIHIQLEMAWKSHFTHAGSLPTDSMDTVEQPAPVEQYLERFPQLDQPQVALRLLKQECLVRQKYAMPATFSECQARFPDMELDPADFESVFAAAASVSLDPDTAGYALKDAVLPLPSNFGGYQLLDELGRGSMGVVYRARQIDADRIVAIKIMHEDASDESEADPATDALVQFRHEAQAAARLVHENIVTVFEAGEVDGRYFFSMRYINGRSLAEMVARQPLDNRAAATYLERVAQAVAYAHRHGVLHRDLRPQNILIQKETDAPLVADFGLARLAERTRTQTRSAEVVGTPSYLSPEQARNASLATETSDIYSLGATLYNVLTGRPPFLAATTDETIRQLLEFDPVAPRLLNPAVDRSLEVICLKCLQKDPQRRYGTVQQVADELDHYLGGESVRGESPTWVAQVWNRFRHSPQSGAAVAALAIVLLLTVASAIIAYRSMKAAQERTAVNFQAAHSTIDALVGSAHRAGLRTSAARLESPDGPLNAALEYYRHFIEQHQNDAQRKAEVALAWFNTGRIEQASGNPAAALKAYGKAAGIQQRLTEQHPSDQQLAYERSNTEAATCHVHGQQGRWEQALTACKQAARTRQSLAEQAPHVERYRQAWANSLADLGRIEEQRKRPDAALRHLQTAQKLRHELLEQQPDNLRTRRALGIGYYDLARIQKGERNHIEALKHFQLAVKHLEQLANNNPGQADAEWAWHLAVARIAIGDSYLQGGQPDKATECYRKAETCARSLVDRTQTGLQREALLAQLYSQFGEACRQQNAPQQALKNWQRSIEKWELLFANNQVSPDYQRQYAITLGRMASAQLVTSNKARAKATLLRAKEVLGQLVHDHPEETEFQDALHDILNDLHRIENLQETDPPAVRTPTLY